MTTPPDDHALDHLRKSGEVVDRRSGVDRRQAAEALGLPPSNDFDRRRGPGRRLADTVKNAEEGQFNREQFLFVTAIDAFKRANHVSFPAWTDVLEVIRLLGYRKTCPSEVPMQGAEDWTEKPDAASNVRRQRPGEH